MQLRHEVKHLINESDRLILTSRLARMLRPDPHAPGGHYHIRSLYFDDYLNTALHEKLDGVANREKFRIRYYNGDTNFIRLEKKCKKGDLTGKVQCGLTREETEQILRGDIGFLKEKNELLPLELYDRMRAGQLVPKVIVDYDRDAFLYPAGNVRVTLDYRVTSMPRPDLFLEPDCPVLPVPDGGTILEVKWDGFLPDFVRDSVQLISRGASSYSKYASARAYDRR